MLKCIPHLLASQAAAIAHAASISAASLANDSHLEKYNVVWTNQSGGSAESMPLAGGVLGLNVWVQENDLLFLIGSPDCLDENGMQVKLGLVRLRIAPAAFARAFRQELNLAKSEITVEGKTEDGQPVTVRLWCDVFQPAVHAEVAAARPVEVAVSYETWSGYDAKFVQGGLQWVKRLAPVNQRRARDMQAQGVKEFEKSVPDPLSNLTMGGRITAPGLAPAGTGTGTFNGMNVKTWTLRTVQPVAKLDLRFALRMEQDASLGDWERKLAAMAMAMAKPERERSLAWWSEFWNRSHIVIREREEGRGSGAGDRDLPSTLDPQASSPAWQAGRNYQLFRYLLAANRGGRMMTLFNGGSFTCTGNPDGRNWDGCQFMGQNQMLVYWPMQRSGDFDLLKVGCDFYRDCTPLRRLHARKFWDVAGVTYPEPLSVFGLDAIGTTKEGRSSPGHLNYHYTSGMVFALMMLGHDAYTGTQTPGYAEAAFGIISYYDEYYQTKLKKETGKPLDANGKLVIYPSDACEPYHGCVNNLDVLAGLMALTRDLLATPPSTLGPPKRAYLEAFRQRIPEFKTEEKLGRTLYAAADKPPEWIFRNTNMDFPQMYICFPFSAVSLGRSDMTLVKNTWELGPVNATVQHQNQCWYQNAINMARMGETARAADFTLKKLLHPGLRFPAFYYTTYLGGGSFCHPPDHDHGGVAMTALQEMLMQTDGRRILLGPAWPADWDCDFKLHAPYRTTVEGRVAAGQVVVDRVTPEARRKDIEIFPLKSLPAPPLSQSKPATASTTYGAGYTPDKAFDGDLATRWSATVGQAAAWLAVDLGAPTTVGRAVVDESSYPQTTKFAVEAQMEDGAWKTVAEGDELGANREVKFTPVNAQNFRLRILESKLINTMSGATVNEFQLFPK
jgi:hypothetical protein